MLRGLRYFWPINLAVVLAVSVSATVLTGALLVGDSVRGSLRDLTLDRLGAINLALTANRFFSDQLGDRLSADPEFSSGFSRVVPAILLRGNATSATTRARASRVSVLGVDDRFVDLFRQPTTSAAFTAGPAATELPLSRAQGQRYPSVIINEALARELSAQTGQELLVRFQLGSEIPRDTVLGRREPTDLVGTIRAEVRGVIPDLGVGRFDLSPQQTFPLIAYVDLGEMQAALRQSGRVNALLLRRRTGVLVDPRALLDRSVGLEDLGLELAGMDSPSRRAGVLEVTSREFVLRPALADAVVAAATQAGLVHLSLQAYLANEMRHGDRTVPYSMVLALDNPDADEPFGSLQLQDGSPPPTLEKNETLLNSWAAQDLGVGVGDDVVMTYYVVGPDEELRTGSTEFRVAGIVAMRGLAIDPELTPDYPGIEDAEHIALWDPPFPVDLSVVRSQDEEYWDLYRGAPKAFVSATTGRRLWSTRYGALTAIRVGEAGSGTISSADFERRLTAAIEPRDLGFRFFDVRRAGLEASSGATDFSGLFIGFSMFIIFSAVLIISLLFRLGIRQRGAEAGLLVAVGYRVRAVRRIFLRDGLMLSVAGSTLGLLGAVGYARLMILGLTTLWLPAVGSPLLFLHVRPGTLAGGWLLSVLVAAMTIWWSTRGITRIPPAQLLAGDLESRYPIAAGSGRRRALTLTSGIAAAVLVAGAMATGNAANPGLAFGIGASLLICGLGAFSLWCHGARGQLGKRARSAVLAMAARNSGWNPGRSMLSVALVAAATFVIVMVASNTRDPESERQVVVSGAGGFTLLATSDVALHDDLSSPEARFDLGFSEAASATLDNTLIEQLRLLPGDDASCLNLYRPQRPRILGVPEGLIHRGGFEFAASLAAQYGVEDNPWKLLLLDLGPGVVPAIADANSAQWIMHIGLGDDVVMDNERGEPLRLRLVGTVRESVFQSELLISEDAFLRQFPSHSGFSYFLIDAPEGSVEAVAATLEDALGTFGFDATPSATKIAGYLVVVNTYLATFMMLGGLGLLLGTLGLGVVLLRNVLERRRELATLRAFGFRRRSLARMVLAENAFLLLVGVGVGTTAALAAVSPRLVLGQLPLPWQTLAPILLAVMAVGMLASLGAVIGSLRIPLLPALKTDR